jgi:hypothetical protein
MQSGFDNSLNFPRSNFGDTTGTWGVLLQSYKPKSQEALPPKLDRWFADTQIARDHLALHTVCSHPNNTGTLHQSQGKASSPHPGVESRVFFWGQYNGRCGFHTPLAYDIPYDK